MAEITVHYSWCDTHLDNHLVDEKGKCFGTGPSDLKRRGFFYLRHVGGGWFRYRLPASNPAPWDYSQETELPEHNIHILEQDW